MNKKDKLVFSLRRIDPFKILKRYKEGYYETFKIPKTKIKIASDVPLLAPPSGTSYDDPTYTFRDRNNRILKIATTNHKNYTFFTRSGGEQPEGGMCDWCRLVFKEKSIGIPIAHIAKTYLDANGELLEANFFWTDGTFCSYNCALAYANLFMSLPPTLRDPFYTDATTLLHFAFRLMHPDKTLISAPHYKLAEWNGGSLTEAEFKSTNFTYKRLLNVVMIPIKFQYLQVPIAQ
jgi:hypothetical protein